MARWSKAKKVHKQSTWICKKYEINKWSFNLLRLKVSSDIIEVTKRHKQGVPDARARTVNTPRADFHSLSSEDEHGPLIRRSRMWASWQARHWNTVGRQVLRSKTVNRLVRQDSQLKFHSWLDAQPVKLIAHRCGNGRAIGQS